MDHGDLLIFAASLLCLLLGRGVGRRCELPSSDSAPGLARQRAYKEEAERRWLWVWHLTLKTQSLRLLLYSRPDDWQELAARDDHIVPPEWTPGPELIEQARRNFASNTTLTERNPE